MSLILIALIDSVGLEIGMWRPRDRIRDPWDQSDWFDRDLDPATAPPVPGTRPGDLGAGPSVPGTGPLARPRSRRDRQDRSRRPMDRSEAVAFARTKICFVCVCDSFLFAGKGKGVSRSHLFPPLPCVAVRTWSRGGSPNPPPPFDRLRRPSKAVRPNDPSGQDEKINWTSAWR